MTRGWKSPAFGELRPAVSATAVGLLTLSLLSDVSHADLNLERLECVELRANVTGPPRLSLSQQTLIDTALTKLYAKAPGIRLRDGCANVLHVRLVLSESQGQEGRSLGHFGAVRLELVRQAILLDTLSRTELTVWHATRAISGPPGDDAEAIVKAVESLVSKFADAYRRSRNP